MGVYIYIYLFMAHLLHSDMQSVPQCRGQHIPTEQKLLLQGIAHILSIFSCECNIIVWCIVKVKAMTHNEKACGSQAKNDTI